MAWKKEEISHEVLDLFGTLKESDKHDWAKVVAKVVWGDNPPTLDIRNANLTQDRLGKGISLSNEEADKLVDLLLDNDYGSIKALENAIQKRKSLYGDVSSEEDDEQLFRIKFVE